MKIEITLTEEDYELLARHSIAIYDGELETIGEDEELVFSPCAFVDTLIVGIYIELMAFDPTT